MPYPSSVSATVIQIGGNSCGSFSGQFTLDGSADPPEYSYDSGDFAYARLARISPSGGDSWELLVSITSGACAGFHTFRLDTPADDPEGDYCLYLSGSTNCAAGQASVVAT